MASLWGELRQRNVVKVAVSYAIVGWLLIEISSVLLPTFEAPHWVLKVIILVIGLGFVLAVFLSWVYELTPQGVVRTDAGPLHANINKYLPDVRALAMLGRKSEALVALRNAIDDGWREIWWLTDSDPTLESIVGEPDFIAMVEEVEADLATQLELMRKMERGGEFAPVPDLVVTQ